ncbi:MAG: hypothetical protein ACR2N9_02805 [Acidimicrobiia bacterium]
MLIRWSDVGSSKVRTLGLVAAAMVVVVFAFCMFAVALGWDGANGSLSEVFIPTLMFPEQA